MTNQEVFDKGVIHILQQDCLSKKGKNCFYYDDNNNRCIIGGVVPENLAQKMERIGGTILKLIKEKEVKEFFKENNPIFLNDMQRKLHDDIIEYNQPDYVNAVREFAKNYDLSMENIEQFLEEIYIDEKDRR